MYKLNKQTQHGSTVTRVSDGAVIPFADGNRDYDAYLAWLAEGNTPEPAETLNEVKDEVRSGIVRKRNDAITGGFPYQGKQIDSDRDSVMAITGAAVAALAAKAANLPYSVAWTCADDSVLALDADGILGMAVTLAMFADAQHSKARPLKVAIKNAPDVAQAKQVVWV